MEPLDRLIAVNDIKNLVSRRCRTLDAQDWETYAACHTPDTVSWAIGSEQGSEEPTRGIEAVIAFLRLQLTGRTTVHQVHSPEIVVTSPETASGIWSMEDRLWWQYEDRKFWLHGFGHYLETYEQHDGRWLISSRRLVRTWVERGSDVVDAAKR